VSLDEGIGRTVGWFAGQPGAGPRA